MLSSVLKYAFFFAVFAILGFSREFIFVNMNEVLYSLYYKHTITDLPNCFAFLLNYKYITLYYSKYVLTLLYFIFYFLASYYAVKIICNNKSYTRWIVYIYSLILVLSILIMGYNYIINNQLAGNEYTFSRWLMGISQSPLVAFFTIATSSLYQSFNTKNN